MPESGYLCEFNHRLVKVQCDDMSAKNSTDEWYQGHWNQFSL